MNASEIIEQIKALPREERQVVVQFVKAFSAGDDIGAKEQTSEFEDLVDRVFDKHANLMHRLAQ